MHRSLWVPGRRAEPFFPLCPRRHVVATTASLPLLRIVSRLSIGVEIDYLDAVLAARARLGVPGACLQRDLTEFIHSDAAPAAHSFGSHSQAAATLSSELIAESAKPTLLIPAQ